MFACKVLHPVLQKLKTALDSCAQYCVASGDCGDDSVGTQMPIGNCLDDCSLVLPFADITFVIDFWEREGPPTSEECTIPGVTCLALYSHLFMYKFPRILNLSTF